MTNSLRPHGNHRAPLPPVQEPAAGVPSPRSPRTTQAADTSPAPGSNTPVSRAASGGAPLNKPAKQRDAFFDNAKYLAIVLVAMGHAWEPLTDHSRAAEALYMTVYTFHMPAFILISGYFSRSFDMRPDRLRRLVTGVAVPYVIFEVAYSFFKRWADDDPAHPISLLDPWYLTWFLVALFVWRLTTPLWKVARWPVPIALGIAMLATVSPDIGDDLDLQRVLQFLPFFVMGLFMKPEHFQMLRRREVRLLSVPVFAGALVVAYWAAPRMSSAWFYHRDSAQELAAPWWAGVVMTLALFGCSMVLTACFFAWVPRRRMWFTVLGAGTLYGYLLHGFLAKGSRFWGWYEDYEWLHKPLGEIFVTLAAAAVVTVLCTPPVQRMFRFAMEPKMEWAFKRDAAELARERAKATS
ncbi:acyltransferase family protein [Streptomyces himalayensis]|uniref:Acyltransferase family protein n=1 Tax=Streptomyces himalayensis subsp. himalayensis TaxID=2756131 RepID=A0A7W0DQY1_9ACTN|nr:acyltransferase family protein [Streptomyces himalayensis]MBA2949245.1 acyltransferase family protein [Streptomyces himalayensis subsp. himalayensis]